MDQLIETLRTVVGRNAVLAERNELLVYECDGLPQHKHLPRAVVFPSSTEETAEVMRMLALAGVAFTPRGAGTGLSGGAVALDRAVVIELARMRQILKIDKDNRLVVVQTGVVNAHVSRAVASLNLHYVPDPSSQPTCTIGGNIAENAGGIHCLKYGTTTDHVMAIRVVMAGGQIVDLGGIAAEQPGYDLRGLFIGSEGTFGIATEATLRLVPIPPSVRTLLAEFAEVTDASHAVSAIIAAGFIPAGLEMMDREIIKAVEASVFAAGLPPDAGAALLIELDGLSAGIDDEADRVKSICLQYGARTCRLAQDENERKKLWAARKGAFGAIGRISPDAMIQDAVVPRSRLPQIMADVYCIAAKYQLRLANVFHAGDGNLHPLICFDSRSAEEVRRVKEAGRELMETCVRAGGSITGEHGVGLDKRDLLSLIFSEDDMETMLRVRTAFDPTGLMNPGKIIPLLRGCGEARSLSEPGRIAIGSLENAAPEQDRVVLNENGADSPTWHSLSATVSDKTVTLGSQAVDPIKKTARFNGDLSFSQLSAIVGKNDIKYSSSSEPLVSQVMTVSPASIAETCEVMKLASSENWSVLPAGAGTWLNAGNPMRRVNVIVNTLRLNRIIEHEPADLIAMTEAGVILRNFNDELMRNGQWLPLDPPGNAEATIGGIVSTGISGLQRFGYGPTRGFVIGLKLVLANGKVIKAGGRVVKNVAGYDLCKLFTGSYGTLGLIVEANFKLRPRPESEATVLASGPVDSLFAAVQTMLAMPLFPVAVELISSGQGKAIGLETNALDVVLLARFAGNHKAVNEQTESALSLLRNGKQTSDAHRLADDADLWRLLATLPSPEDKYVSWRASVPPADLPTLMKSMSKIYADAFSSLIWQSSICDGRIWAIEDPKDPADGHVPVLQELRSECQRLGGSLILESAPFHVRERFDAWGDLGKAMGLMQRIKQQLDPQNILAPGRFGPNF